MKATSSHQVEPDTGYEIYEKADIADVATLTDVTAKASAELDAAELVKVEFSDIDTSNIDKASKMVEGQNVLMKALENEQISKTYTAANGEASFSHEDFKETDYEDLDTSIDGKVSYKGEEIATLKNVATTGKTLGAAVKIGGADMTKKREAKFATTGSDDEFNFEITKGETEVK